MSRFWRWPVRLPEDRSGPGAQILGLADIDDLAFRVFVKVHARLSGEGADFLVEVHERANK